MKAAISVSFVLFGLLLPSEGASNVDKSASPSTKVRLKFLYDQILDPYFYIFVHNRSFLDILPNFNLLRT